MSGWPKMAVHCAQAIWLYIFEATSTASHWRQQSIQTSWVWAQAALSRMGKSAMRRVSSQAVQRRSSSGERGASPVLRPSSTLSMMVRPSSRAESSCGAKRIERSDGMMALLCTEAVGEDAMAEGLREYVSAGVLRRVEWKSFFETLIAPLEGYAGGVVRWNLFQIGREQGSVALALLLHAAMRQHHCCKCCGAMDAIQQALYRFSNWCCARNLVCGRGNSNEARESCFTGAAVLRQ